MATTEVPAYEGVRVKFVRGIEDEHRNEVIGDFSVDELGSKLDDRRTYDFHVVCEDSWGTIHGISKRNVLSRVAGEIYSGKAKEMYVALHSYLNFEFGGAD